MDAPLPDLGGRYRVESVLGTGGMGVVYAATDLRVRRRVAVKMLRPESVDDADSLERLREEAFSLASIRHPNIVQLYDFVFDGPHASFMIMELVDGESLSARLRRQAGPMPLEPARELALQLLSALAAAHAQGLVHRDIKPGNILLTSLPGRGDLVKVVDFGIAKLAESTIRRRPTTRSVVLGTPGYMAPEQAAGEIVDHRADVYAAALVFYRMLAGVNPFEAPDIATTLHRVVSMVPPPLSEYRPDLPSPLVRALGRALSKDRERRYANALELYGAIGGAVSDVRDRPLVERVIAVNETLPITMTVAPPVQRGETLVVAAEPQPRPAGASTPPPSDTLGAPASDTYVELAPQRGAPEWWRPWFVVVAGLVVALSALIVWHLTRRP